MNMKAVLPLFGCLCLLLCASAASGQYTRRPGGEAAGVQPVAGQGDEGSSAGLGLAFVTYLSGESLLKGADDEDWVALAPQLSLRTDDRLWTQDGAKAEVRFPLGATAWVNYRSELDITRLERGDRADTIQLALVSGEATFDVKAFARRGSVFQVDVPNASIRSSGAARFRVNTLPDGTAQIGVIDGSLVVETPDGLVDVGAGQMAELQPDRRILLDFLPAGDEWDAWVQSRAEIYDRPSASLGRLPDDLASYAHEFDTDGRWASDPDYGSVWVPAVEQGWSPYSNGRWVWRGNDYVWLGFDRWYAPFHFGRWGWRAAVGWFWIAPRGRAYWSPGYVGWSISGDDVCWVPLGHNEVYYGYGNFGPGSVNVFRTTAVNVTNVYVNSRVANGVVVVRRDDFLRGKIVRVRIDPSRNPFLAGGAGGAGGVKIIGRAPVLEIRPIRETRQARPELEVKRVTLPPVRLDRESRIIKERVLAPTKEKSVFRPGNKPAPLQNVVKERELELWVAPRKAPAAKAVVVPPPAQANKGEPPVKTPPQVIRVREVQLPSGKHLFKRISEPQGGAFVAPAPVPAPVEVEKVEKGEKGEKEKQSSGQGHKK